MQAALAAVDAGGFAEMLDMNMVELANRTLERAIELLDEYQAKAKEGEALTLGDVAPSIAGYERLRRGSSTRP